MSIAKKCDRCGKFYEQYNVKNDHKNINGIMTLNIDGKQNYFSHGPYDLCQECSANLYNWLKCWEGLGEKGDENREDNSSVG